MSEPTCQYETKSPDDVPEKALKLARRVAGLRPERVAVRYSFDVIVLPDGTWWLDVERKKPMEYLGQ